MRPTDLHFRPINEQTPGPSDSPTITRDGSPLLSRVNFLTRKYEHQTRKADSQGELLKKPAFGSSERRHVGANFKLDGNSNIGPGLYEINESALKLMKRQPCQVKYKQLSVGKELASSGSLHYEGGRLIFEPNFTDPRKSQPSFAKFDETFRTRLPTQTTFFMRSSNSKFKDTKLSLQTSS